MRCARRAGIGAELERGDVHEELGLGVELERVGIAPGSNSRKKGRYETQLD